MSDDSDSDYAPPVDSEADAGPTERELMVKYANEVAFHVDMTRFEESTLDYGYRLLSHTIFSLRNSIENIERNIRFLEREVEKSDIEACSRDFRFAIARNNIELDRSKTRLDRFIQKRQYVNEKIEELQLSEPDTEVGEGWPDGELHLHWRSDSEEDFGEGWEERGEFEEERGDSEAELGDPVLSGWRRLLRQHQFTVDVAAFLDDTGLRDVDIQPFVDCEERGTAEEVQQRIDELEAIFMAVVRRRNVTTSQEDYEQQDWGREDLRVRHLDSAEMVLEDLIYDLRYRRDALRR